MSDKPIKVLLIEDNPGDARFIQELLSEAKMVSFKLKVAKKLSDGLEALSARRFDVVLLDLSLSDSSGLETLVKVHMKAQKVAIIVLTGLSDEALAVEALREGAQDYLVKGQIDGNLLYRAILYAIERKQAEEEKKKLQAQLQQTQKMEAIGTLAGGIAHDFNNILSLIIGYTELALDDVPEGIPVWDNINEAYKAGKRARDLVKQILTFSRQSESERKPVKIHLIVTETLKLIHSSLPTTIEIRENITTTGMALVDPMQIEQVIMNLATNAYYAMRETGGLLEVSLHNVECGMRNADLKEDERRSKIQIPKSEIDLDHGPYLRLTVSDSGHGIEKKNINRIFEPYYTTKEKSGGTGMGLAIVHGIVKGHGGTITVESELGKGTKFHVFLPIIESAEEVVEIEEVALPLRGKERILFVDDEPGMINIGKQILERLGYKVVARTSSIEALEAFRAQPDKFDLVITDMTMPNMTGDALAKKFMDIRCDIPIILCTGFSERINEEKAKAIGIRKFVMKPLVMSELAEAVREALG